MVLLCLLFGLPNQTLHSQDLLDRQADRFPYIPGQITSYTDTGYEGTVYIEEEVLPAKLGNQSKLDFLRYDAYADRMEIKKNGQMHYLGDFLNTPIHFTGIDKTYQYLKFKDRNELEQGYFVHVYQGTGQSLWLKERITLAPEVKQRTTFDKYQPPTFKRVKDQLYLKGDDGIARPVPSRKKHFLRLFAKEDKDVEAFIKQEALDIGKKEDLIRLIQYLEAS